MKYSEGETVFKQGDPATSVYLVTAGKLDCEVGAADGAETKGAQAGNRVVCLQ